MINEYVKKIFKKGDNNTLNISSNNMDKHVPYLIAEHTETGEKYKIVEKNKINYMFKYNDIIPDNLDIEIPRIVIAGSIYKHFKGELYLGLGIAYNYSDTKTYVIYQALYDECRIYAREIDMFFGYKSENYSDEEYPQEKRFAYLGHISQLIVNPKY